MKERLRRHVGLARQGAGALETARTVLEGHLGPVEARVEPEARRRGEGRRPDAWMRFHRGGRTYRLPVEVIPAPNRARLAYLERRIATAHEDRARHHPRALIVADYMPPKLGEEAIEEGFAYVDACGNVHIWGEDQLLVHVEGKRPAERTPAIRDPFGTAPLLRILYVLLADPDAAALTYRGIAARAGTALGTVTNAMRALRAMRLLRRTGPRTWAFEDRARTLERWAEGYGLRLRPRMRPTTLRAPHELRQVLRDLAARRRALPPGWAVTGPLAAELLTRTYRAGTLTVVVPRDPRAFIERARWLPDPDGPITVLAAPTPAFGRFREVRGLPVAHPLQVYAELIWLGPGREQEAAQMIRTRYLA